MTITTANIKWFCVRCRVKVRPALLAAGDSLVGHKMVSVARLRLRHRLRCSETRGGARAAACYAIRSSCYYETPRSQQQRQQSPYSVQEPRYGNWVRAPAAAECGGRVSECRSAVPTRAGHEPSRSLKFTIAEEATARAFSLLKVTNYVKTLIYCTSLMIFLSAISCQLMYLWVNG